MVENVCTWAEDEDGIWFTGCNNAFEFMNGTPSENGFQFCCYCGDRLKEVKYAEQD